MGKKQLVESGRVCSTTRDVTADEIFNSDGTAPQEPFEEIAEDTPLVKVHFTTFTSSGDSAAASGSYWIVKLQKSDEATFAVPSNAVN